MRATGTVSVIRILGRSSKIEVEGRPDADFEVRGGDVELRDDGSVDVTAGSGRVHVVCSEHADVAISTGSGAVQVLGHIAGVRVLTGSGRVRIERTVRAEIRSTSGSVRIGSCVGECRIVTTSGTVHVGDAHRVEISTGSSSVEIGRTTTARVRTVSGTVEIGGTSSAAVAASTMSGRVTVRLPAGTLAAMRLQSRSGRIVRDEAVVDVGSSTGGEGGDESGDASTDRASIDVVTSSGAIKVVAT